LSGHTKEIQVRAQVSDTEQVFVPSLTHHTHNIHICPKKRVQFRAPQSLVNRADSLAEVLDTDRTDVLGDSRGS